jgi:hypothetical protein
MDWSSGQIQLAALLLPVFSGRNPSDRRGVPALRVACASEKRDNHDTLGTSSVTDGQRGRGRGRRRDPRMRSPSLRAFALAGEGIGGPPSVSMPGVEPSQCPGLVALWAAAGRGSSMSQNF